MSQFLRFVGHDWAISRRSILDRYVELSSLAGTMWILTKLVDLHLGPPAVSI